MRSLIFVACLAGLVMGSWKLWNERAQHQPPGILAPLEPGQYKLGHPVEFRRHEYRIVGRAEFDITARVILRSHYRYDDLARLMPVDLALGWGVMSDSATLERMSCSQSNRFYGCTWKTRDVIDPGRFTALSANMHMIPATTGVEDALLRVRPGQVVSLRGYLVDVIAPNGGSYRTSMTRKDSGPGACEIIWVTDITAS
jgi:hypothetical protein